MPRQRLPATLGDDIPSHKACPDCYAEGRDPYILPIATHFYVKRSPRYKGGYRVSTYCIEHEKRRATEREVARFQKMLAEERRTGVTPPALARKRERDRAAAKTERGKSRLRRGARAWREKHPERARAAYRKWLAKPGNVEQRKVYQAEWFQSVGKERRRMQAVGLGNGIRRRRRREEERRG